MSGSKTTANNHSSLSHYMQSLGRAEPICAEREARLAKAFIREENMFLKALIQVPHVLDALEGSLWEEITGAPLDKAFVRLFGKIRDQNSADNLSRAMKLRFEELIQLYRKNDGDRQSLNQLLSVGLTDTTSASELQHLHTNMLRARNQFVESNLRLVVSIAGMFKHRKVQLVDMIQDGNLGLVRAIYRYDPEKGFRFSTYAHWWIRQAIERSLMNVGNTIRIPVHVFDARRELAKIERACLETGREKPSAAELADYLGVSLDRYREIAQAAHVEPMSLDDTVYGADTDGRALSEIVSDKKTSVDDRVHARLVSEKIEGMLSELTPMESDILHKRFGLVNTHEQTLSEIGETYELSRERIRQIQERSLKKLKKYCERRLQMTGT